jgi:hypothetical protein
MNNFVVFLIQESESASQVMISAWLGMRPVRTNLLLSISYGVARIGYSKGFLCQ